MREDGAHRERSLRVLHVIDSLSGGGAEHSLRQVLLATARTVDHSVALLRPDPDGLAFLQRGAFPSFVPTARLARVRALAHVHRAISAVTPHVVHTTLFEADLAGRVTARVRRVPTLTTLVGVPYAERESVRAAPLPKRAAVIAVDRMLGRHATTHFHAVTSRVADETAATLGISRQRVSVVPRGRSREALGEPSDERRHRARRSLGIDVNEFLILNVAREEHHKGHHLLVEALAELRDSTVDWRCVIAGPDGRASSALGRQIADAGLERKVLRLGERRDVPELLCAADVFAFPSLHEGAAGAVLEAMALEVPVVVHDVPELRDLLEGGRLGAVVDAAEPTSFARALGSVRHEWETWRRRTESARAVFDREYELQVVAAGMTRLWAAVAERSHVSESRP